MKKNFIILSIITFVVILIGVGIFALGYKNDNNPSSKQSQIINGDADKESNDYKRYAKLSGEAYDRLYLANMIEHHRGAVDMADLALFNANHQELKDMALKIIEDQSEEISNMQSWQIAWGYPESSGESMMDHSAMGMENDMIGMTNDLNGLEGDEFDKLFLDLMIQHHQSAINMSIVGQENAQHDELKILTKNIVEAQQAEIKQMKQWQIEWGY